MAEILSSKGVSHITRLFEELRDQLLAASSELAKGKEPDWTQAERFFSASKKVDELSGSVLQSIRRPGTSEVPAARARADHTEGSSEPAERPKQRKSKKDYPKYEVRAGALTKIGLSRDRRTEYEHAVPKAEFDAVVARLSELASRKHFEADDVIEKVSCPSYQVYIVISLLKERGLLLVPRRGMYAFSRPKTFINESESIWTSLGQNHTEDAHE